MQTSPEHAIKHYLRCGEYDPNFGAWPGGDYLSRSQQAGSALRNALRLAIHRRTPHVNATGDQAGLDVVTHTRERITPMVLGLFSRSERQPVLDALSRSVVLLSSATIDGVIDQTPRLRTAWNLGNLFLAGVKAELLGEEAPHLVGLSEGTNCYLSSQYFSHSGRFDDFLVHEVAHIFHNCKRHTIGLRATRQQEWLLEIDFTKRETFAYSCEVYGRIHQMSDGPNARRMLLKEYATGSMPEDMRLDPAEHLDILDEAVTARNGWKRILARCAPIQHRHRSDLTIAGGLND